MLLRSSSSPILNSWIAIHKETSSEAELPPIPKPRSISLSPSSNSSSPGSESSRVWSKKLNRTLSESDLLDLTLPPQIPKRKSASRRQKNNHSAVSVKGLENQEKGLNPFSFHQMFSSSGFVEMAGIDEGCSDQVKGKALPLLPGGGFDGGAGGSGICGGRGGRGDGGQDGNGGSDANNEHESTEAYYQRMIEANPENSLLLTNYAKFLKEVRADSIKAEEYCSRAILANPGDGEVLCMYGNLIWENNRDAQRAENYFDQAVQASPNDSFVMASYARFLWETEEEEENEGEDETKQSSFFQGAASCHPPLAAMS